jgi:hypothetical protein
LAASPELEVSGLLSTPTGTMTLGGEAEPAPATSDDTCCIGGMVEQYSIGLAGFGLEELFST